MEWNSGPHNLWSTSLTIRLRRFLLNWIIYYIYKVNQTKYSTFTPCVLSWINKAIRMNLIRLENRNKIPSGADVSIQHFNKKMVTTSSWGNEMKKKKRRKMDLFTGREGESSGTARTEEIRISSGSNANYPRLWQKLFVIELNWTCQTKPSGYFHYSRFSQRKINKDREIQQPQITSHLMNI